MKKYISTDRLNEFAQGLLGVFVKNTDTLTDADITEIINSIATSTTDDWYSQLINQVSTMITNNVVDNLQSQDSTKSLSARQGFELRGLIDSLVSSISQKTTIQRNLLFQGAIKTGDITLNDNMYNYRFLYIKISASASGYTYGGGIYPIIDPTLNNSSNKTQSFMGYEVPSEDTESSPNSVNTYSGIFVNKNETTLTVVKQVSNVSHQSGKNHGGGTKYYVREVIGIR